MKPLVLALAATFSLCAQTPDLYPQVRALVLEAEAASTNIRLFRDHGDPHTWAGNILEHAGYLEDAERAYAASPRPSSDLPYIWRGCGGDAIKSALRNFSNPPRAPEKSHLSSVVRRSALAYRAARAGSRAVRGGSDETSDWGTVDTARRKQC